MEYQPIQMMPNEANSELDNLIELCRAYKMTRAERDEQVKSFAYGNVALHNPTVTRADVEHAFAVMGYERVERD